MTAKASIVCISFPASVDPFEDRAALIELFSSVPDFSVSEVTSEVKTISLSFSASCFSIVADRLEWFINDALTLR